jgi:hypothetical protein
LSIKTLNKSILNSGFIIKFRYSIEDAAQIVLQIESSLSIAARNDEKKLHRIEYKNCFTFNKR